MMLLDCSIPLCRFFIYSVAVVSLVINWEVFPQVLPNFWFGRPRDIGITVYLLLVSGWVAGGLSLRILAPVFLADPAGAVVGRWASEKFGKRNPRWLGEKTVAGSVAVFVLTFLSLYSPAALPSRLAVAALATVGEAVGGAFDNLTIAMIVIVSSLVF